VTRRLSRRTHPEAGPPAPVRLVHLGLGAFHRAHQAWYQHASARLGGEPWGIAAFTGRRPTAAVPLREQDGLYTLVVRHPQGDQAELVTSLSEAHDGADAGAWCARLASPDVGIVTLTITEAGYRLDPTGGLNLSDPDVAADLAELRRAGNGPLRTAPGRLVRGLASRHAAGGGPLAVVPCDNLSDNGQGIRRVLLELSDAVDGRLASWIAEQVGFVSTMVDRITPSTTDDDRRTVTGLTGWQDRAPVVTEPFSEWVLAGTFPSGRPAWERTGARFVADVTPFEQRKLWLLNGAHSLLAYAGSARGHTTIAEAFDDPTCSTWVEQWWDEASRHLPLPEAEVTAYRTTLRERFTNPRIRHALEQIAADGSQKLPVRVLPVLHQERPSGSPEGAVRILGSWLAHLRGIGAPVRDPRAGKLVAAARGGRERAATAVLTAVQPGLGEDRELARAVAEACRELGG
jgi:fructuronate reductase